MQRGVLEWYTKCLLATAHVILNYAPFFTSVIAIVARLKFRRQWKILKLSEFELE